MANRTFKKKEQEGAALLALLAMVVVGGTGALLGMVNQINHTAKRNTHDAVTLAKAKEALIAYGVKYASDNFWSARLPCPASDDLGGDVTVPPPDCALTIGRLPWKKLEIDDLRDSAGEVLWYALPNKFWEMPTSPVNTGTKGNLTVTNGPSEDVVAVVFAPGKVLSATSPSQNRPSVNPADYLEDSNKDGDTPFESSGVKLNADGDVIFNDVVLAITQSELMTAVERLPGLDKTPDVPPTPPDPYPAPDHILEFTYNAIQNFVTTKNYYPYASLLGGVGSCTTDTNGNLAYNDPSCGIVSSDSRFNYNRWFEVIYYAVDVNCTSLVTDCTSGLTVDSVGKQAVAIYAGRPRNQTRPSADPTDYLEDSENFDGPPAFTATTSFNDAIIGLNVLTTTTSTTTTSTTTSTVTTTTATTTTTSINMNQPNTIDGGSGDDIIYSGNQGDVVYGNAGNDQIFGGNGNDIIYGGTGSDQLDGENGSDIIYGGAGSDQIYGGNGSDTIYGGADDDQMYGGNGDDTFMIEPDSGQDTIEGGGGNNDTINLTLALLTGNPGVGNWTMKINGSFINNVNTPYSVPNEATGFISINNGASTITFVGVEKIVW